MIVHPERPQNAQNELCNGALVVQVGLHVALARVIWMD